MYRIISNFGIELSGIIDTFGEAQEAAELLEAELDVVACIEAFRDGEWVRCDPVMSQP